MIKNYISGGWLIEAFVFLPSFDLNWMKLSNGKSAREFRITWLFWYVSFGNVKKKLKEAGY